MEINTVMLVEDVINDRLQRASDPDLTFEERTKALQEAKEAKRLLDQLKEETVEKKKKINWDLIVDLLKIGVPVLVLVMDFGFKMVYMYKICNFEREGTFTTTAGKSMKDFFRFK